mmetsp:Transcript_12135/g.19714  ORF Transcript_12135/g.19714 Transcript_12135/m.19714 type:complete len:208 (+) Transcript_12135:551-1174(+)
MRRSTRGTAAGRWCPSGARWWASTPACWPTAAAWGSPSPSTRQKKSWLIFPKENTSTTLTWGSAVLTSHPIMPENQMKSPIHSFFLPEVEGTLIVRVAEHGPSALPGGLRAGDVVQAVGGAPVQRFEQLRAALEARGAVGEPLEITVIRGGVTQTVEVIPEDTVAVKAKEEKMRKQLDEKMREFEDMLPPHMRIIPPRGGGRGYGLP